MSSAIEFLRFTCQGSSSHFSRLHTAIRLPESDENRAEPTIPDRGYSVRGTSIRLNFQLASNSWIGSNQSSNTPVSHHSVI
eukprot:scaffold36045_cov66-Skeletonema_marinoi.AAC.2